MRLRRSEIQRLEGEVESLKRLATHREHWIENLENDKDLLQRELREVKVAYTPLAQKLRRISRTMDEIEDLVESVSWAHSQGESAMPSFNRKRIRVSVL